VTAQNARRHVRHRPRPSRNTAEHRQRDPADGEHGDRPAPRRAAGLPDGRSRPAPRRWFAFTTQASRSAYDVAYRPGDVLVFGSETRGLPPSIVAGFPADQQVRIPMREGVRSLNLSNAVAVAVYEAWRQQGFVSGR
jgi:tRNA(Leu) C34 or U34 (ribose-2'-O)-methylase TrmL